MRLVSSILALAVLSKCLLALCPPTGPVLPPPLLTRNTWNTKWIDDIVRPFELSSRKELKTTFFSVSVTSTENTIFSYHYTPKTYNSSGTHNATGSSPQRVASITKLFTVLAVLLQDGMNLDDPIARYIPELATQQRWQAVTLRMLAGQHGGVARDVPAFDLALTAPLPFEKMGFPQLNSSQLPQCSCDFSQPLCSRQDFFDIFLRQDLVWRPSDRAAYSDLGFILLGYALENVTGRAYLDIIKDTIAKPIGLKNTGFDTPNMADSIVPRGTPWFGFDVGNFRQTAGIYSTTDDLCTFLRAIMNGTLLSKSRVREWLKPAIFTSSPFSAVGMPWEIFRSTAPPPWSRPIDLYTKDGDLPAPGGYAAHVALIPEYNVGLVITGAGDYAFETVTKLLNLVGGPLILELENMARAQADVVYSGRYIGAKGESNDTALVFHIDDGPGIKISEWTSNGANMLQSLAEITGDGPNANDIDARIYPVGEGERWRLQVESVSSAGSVYNGSITARACMTWSDVDKLRYGMLPVDEFDFKIDPNHNGSSVVTGVELLGLREHLIKVD